MDAKGEVVRHFSSDAKERSEQLRVKKGMNHINWNLTKPNPKGVDGVFVGLGAGGHRLAPGKYTAKITYGEQEIMKALEVVPDPRWSATDAQYAEQQKYLSSLRQAIDGLQERANDIRSIRSQVNDLKSRISAEDWPQVHEQVEAIIEMINKTEEQMVQPNQKTFQDVINFPNKLEVELLHIYGTIDGIEPPVTNGQIQRYNEMLTKYTLVMDESNSIEAGLDQLMEYIRTNKVPFIAAKKQ